MSRRLEISPKIYIDVMGYPRDIVIEKLDRGFEVKFPDVLVLSLGGGISVTVSQVG